MNIFFKDWRRISCDNPPARLNIFLKKLGQRPSYAVMSARQAASIRRHVLEFPHACFNNLMNFRKTFSRNGQLGFILRE